MIRKLIGITAIYLSVSLCGLAQTERIVILHTNDTHSQMEPFAATHKTYGGLGGVMRRMAIIDSIRNAEPNVLLVDAGDAIQGTPYFNLFKGDADDSSDEFYERTVLRRHAFVIRYYRDERPLRYFPDEFDGYDQTGSTDKKLDSRFYLFQLRRIPYTFARDLATVGHQKVGKYKIGFLALNVNPDNLIPSESCKG